MLNVVSNLLEKGEIMRLVLTIPYSDSLKIPINEPGYTFVVQNDVLLVYKQIRP